MDEPSGLWEQLPVDLRERIDAELQSRRLLWATVMLRDGAGMDPRPSLYEAQDIVVHRLR